MWQKLGGNPCIKPAAEALFDFTAAPDSSLDHWIKNQWHKQMVDSANGQSAGKLTWVRRGIKYNQTNYGGLYPGTTYGIRDTTIGDWEYIRDPERPGEFKKFDEGDSVEVIRYVAKYTKTDLVNDTTKVTTTFRRILDHYPGDKYCDNLGWFNTSFTKTEYLPPKVEVKKQPPPEPPQTVIKRCQLGELEIFTGLGYNGNYPWGLPFGGRINLWPVCALNPYLAAYIKAFTSWQASYEPILGFKGKMSWENCANAQSIKIGLRIASDKKQHFVGYLGTGKNRYRWQWKAETNYEAEIMLSMGRWKGEAIVAHYPSVDYTWSRMRGKYAIKDWAKNGKLWAILYVGPEYFWEGQSKADWYFVRYGGLVEFYKPVGKNVWYSICISAGHSDYHGIMGSSYAALEFCFGYKFHHHKTIKIKME
ncbi:hypothetical protein KJ840_03050 [Patescibacteria group bacterium]|nr:hypothetical protein [Patescibacteria group bacterium]